MSTSKSGPGKLTIAVLLSLVVLTPIVIVSALVVGLQPLNAPSSPREGAAASSSSTVSLSAATSNSVTISPTCQNGTTYDGIDSTSPAIYNSSTTSFPIFSMRPGQTSVLCVAWISSLGVSNSVNITGSASIGDYATHTFPNGTLKTMFVPAANVTVTPAQSPIVLGGGVGPLLVVAYTITAAQGSKGFYFLNVQGLSPVGCDDEFRFAVGYAFTEANKTGQYFLLPAGMGSCGDAGGVLGPPMPPPGAVYSQIYATSGIQITDLNCSSFLCDLKQPSG